MNIFHQIKNSIYGKEYYRSVVLNQSTGESVKYLAKLCLLVALLGALVLSFSLPTLNKKIKSGVVSFVASYPEDLVLSVKNGNASINRPEPFIVKIPNYLIDDSNSKPAVDNLIVVNTTEPFSLDKFMTYSTFSLLTKTELITRQPDNGEMRIMPLSKFGNFEITKTWLLDKEVMLMKILPWAIFSLIPLVYLGIFIGIFVGSLIILFLYALIAFIIFKIKKIDITYKKSYQVALHASTILIILGIFSTYVGFLGNFWLKLLILIIIIIINFDGYSSPIQPKETIFVSESTDVKNPS